MSKSINFLKKQAIQVKVKQTKFLYAKICLIFSLAAYVIIVILLVVYSLVLNKQKTVVQEQLSDVKKNIESLKSVETKQILLKHKTASLTEILTSQTQHQVLIETVFQLIPNGVMISGLNINKNGIIGFSAKTQDLNLLEAFLDNLNDFSSNQQNNQLKNISIESVMYNFQNGYTANINLFFAEVKNE